MTDRRLIPLAEQEKLWYSSCAALQLDGLRWDAALDIELEQMGTVGVKEGDVG